MIKLTVTSNDQSIALVMEKVLRGPQGPIGVWAPWIPKTASYVAAAADRILADTSVAPIVISLPPNPVAGDQVAFKSGGFANVHTLTIARNTQTIMGLLEDMTVSSNNIEFTLAWDGATWRL